MTRPLRILESTTNATEASPIEAAAVVSAESDYVVILAALLCALICVVGLIAVVRCAWLRRGSVAGASGASGNSSRQALANKGLKKKVLNSLPKFTYVDDNPNKWVASSECAICLAEFVAGDEVRVLPQCGHGFHVACIDTWLGSHSSCPSCRALLAVARCKKCGHFSTVTAGEVAVAVGGETESKSVGGGNANAHCVIGNGIRSNVMSYHHSSLVSNFLP